MSIYQSAESAGNYHRYRMFDAAQRIRQTALTFTTREEYLAWVIEWKTEYAKIAKELRELRIELSKPHVVTARKYHEYFEYYTSEQSDAQRHQSVLRDQATMLLLMRRESKVLAGQQRAARLQQ